MKYIFSKFSELNREIKDSKHVAILLDFDGTISPIVKKPEDAYITQNTKNILKKLNEFFPITIVTGRPFNVIIKKVGNNNFLYGASHGLEWNFGGKLEQKILPKSTTNQINEFRETLRKVKEAYTSLIIEDKTYSITFHYHLMSVKDKKSFTKWLSSFLKNIKKKKSIKFFHDKETVDITPSINWTKGDITKLALKYLHKKTNKKFTPIYIGDSKTDEDAFKALKKDGITIRVGENKKSRAKWYLKNQKEVNTFLKWILLLKQ